MPGTAIIVSCKRTGRTVAPRTVRRRAERLLSLLDLSGSELSLVLCDDSFIRELNRDYRGIDKATDVLAFPMGSDEVHDMAPVMLGDVVISVESAARTARRRGRSLVDEATSLLIHGVLHLIGYRHEDRDESA